MEQGTMKAPMSIADMDTIDTQAVEYLLHDQDPDVILIHLINADHAQHQFGTDSWEVMQAIQGVDSDVARIVRGLDPKKTTVIVTGDHGFATYTQLINIQPLIRAAGLFDEVVAQTDGGQAAIYPVPGGKSLKPSQKDVCAILARKANHYSKGLLTPISKQRLKMLHAYPDALCALDAKIGFAFGYKASALVTEPTDHPRGHHGYLPTHPEMTAGFFIWGKGLSHPGEPLASDPKMPDIAPTAAQILGIPFDASAGTAIGF
jgi:predicted AlkP superfamily pyrophosphatase or phosphodiesterase